MDDNFDLTLDVLEDIVENEGVRVVKQKQTMRVDNRTVYTLSGIQSVQEFLPKCRKAIAESKNITITYEPYTKRINNITVSPYVVVEYNNRWSVIGRLVDVEEENSVFHQKERIGLINNLAFDRITSLVIDDNSEFVKSEININKILDSAIGTSVDWKKGLDAIEDVILEFSDKLFPYFMTKHLHDYKNIEYDKRIITYSLIPTLELENIILSYGGGIKVIEPESLKIKIIDRLNENIKQYEVN